MNTKITFIMLLCTFFTFAQNEFISIWKPSNPSKPGTGTTSTQISLPVLTLNYNVYWEEVDYPSHNGTLLNQFSTVIIDFGSPVNPVAVNATYLIKISATNLRLSFNNSMFGDNKKIINITQWGTSSWTTFVDAFSSCENLDVSANDVPNLSNCTNMYNMFGDCTSLVGNSSFNNWNVSNITNLSFMFYNAIAFNQNISSWNTTNVVDMSYLFYNATAFNQNIGSWNTANVKSMASTFHSATSFNQNIENWITSKVITMNSMFYYASIFNQNISNWNTTNVIDMKEMFRNSSAFNQNISIWNTVNVTDMRAMFANAITFNQSLGNLNLTGVPNMAEMLYYSGINCLNYENTLISWANTNTPNNITLGAAGIISSYAAQVAKNSLITQKNWVISGDNFNATCAALNDENFITTNTKIYPNPVQNIVNVEVDGLSEIEVFDVNGRFLIKKQASENKNSIDISSLSKGIYILKVSSATGNGNFKIIKE